MKIKIFCPNVNGKLEFTKEELENLLNEAYNDGYRDGSFSKTWTYTYPTITYNSSGSTTDGIVATTPCCDSVSLNDLASTSINAVMHEYCKVDANGQVHMDIQGLSRD